MKQQSLSCGERLRQVGSSPSGEEINLLLECFRRGELDLTQLIELATSEQDGVAEIGVFIASELPERAHAVVPSLRHLLGHDSPRVRSDMLGLLSAVAASDQSGLHDVQIVVRLADPHVAVRCKALSLVSRWTDERMRAALSRAVADGSVSLGADEQDDILSLVSALRGLDQFFSTVDRLSRSRRERVAAMAQHVREWAKIDVDSGA